MHIRRQVRVKGSRHDYVGIASAIPQIGDDLLHRRSSRSRASGLTARAVGSCGGASSRRSRRCDARGHGRGRRNAELATEPIRRLTRMGESITVGPS